MRLYLYHRCGCARLVHQSDDVQFLLREVPRTTCRDHRGFDGKVAKVDRKVWRVDEDRNYTGAKSK